MRLWDSAPPRRTGPQPGPMLSPSRAEGELLPFSSDKMKRAVSVFLSCHLVLLACLLAATGRAQAPLEDAKFAVEIAGAGGFPSGYITLSNTGSSSIFHDQGLRRLAGSDPNPNGCLPTALRLDYRVESELVLIAATVLCAQFDREAAAESLNKLPGQKAGLYSAGLNQQVTLHALRQFGLEPLTLKIVSAQPPLRVRPQTMSKAPSIAFTIDGEDRVFYRLALRNLSQRVVSAVRVAAPQKDGTQQVESYARSLIAPGATYHLQFAIPRPGRMSGGRFVEDPPASTLVLEAAVFADGAYEGDMQSAAEITSKRIGVDTQRRRVDRLIASILSDSQSDDEAKVARIRSEIALVSDVPDREMIEEVRTRFPTLPPESIERVVLSLRIGLRDEKQSVIHALKEWERNGALASHGFTLAKWWNARREN